MNNRPPSKHTLAKAWLATASLLFAAYGQANPALPGGLASVNRQDHTAFSQPSANMPIQRRLDFSVGNSFFRSPWVPAPSSTDARDGLGPLFNSNACQNCHLQDGRGKPPAANEDPVSLLLRISIPNNNNPKHGVQAEPTYGTQLHNRAILGVAPPARLRISYQEIPTSLSDGTIISLRQPKLHISDLAYGPLAPSTQFSLRLAPAMIGLGLLAAISEHSLTQQEDPNDKNKDGISGRGNRVWDINQQRLSLGRFGWKAGQPSLAQQNASAFAHDMGIANSLVQPNCPQAEQAKACREAPNGGALELAPPLAEQVNFYSANLAVPKARPLDASVQTEGAALFNQLKCSACHTPRFITGTADDKPGTSDKPGT
ncbi:MAG: hypothetical protein RL497_939, partial [Pseudomonadota bacterium]